MPFIEVFDFNATPEQRRAATRNLTDGLCAAYSISPSIVSTYFIDVGACAYGHAGEFDEKANVKRIFIKVHAFPRNETDRAVAAKRLTEAALRSYEVPSEKHVVVYFLDRDPGQVSHGGVLESVNRAIPDI